METKSAAVEEIADRTALFGIAMVVTFGVVSLRGWGRCRLEGCTGM